MALLPETHRDPVVENAWNRFSDNIGKQVVFLIGGDESILATEALEKKLTSTGLFSSITFRINKSEGLQAGEFYFPFMSGLLSKEDRKSLKNNNAGVIRERVINSLYSPVSTVSSELLTSDPFMVFPQFLNAIPRPKAEIGKNGEVFFKDDKGGKHYLLTALIDGDLFSMRDQARLEIALNEATGFIKGHYPSISLLKTGSIYYSASAGSRARQEISTIGAGSVLGIVLLIIIVFRAISPLWLSFISTGFGIMLAFVVTFLFLGRIHLFTLVFGASLIGVSVDYAFHFFASRLEGERDWTGWKAVRHIFPGVTLGLITSVIAYLSLAATPFPGLRQLALFSSVGLVGSYLTVMILFPVISSTPIISRSRLLNFTFVQIELWKSNGRYISVASILLIIFIVSGWMQLNIEDDIRLLQPPAEDLKQQEKDIRNITKQSYSNYLFVVQGKDSEEVLQKEEHITDRLDDMGEAVLNGYRSVTQHIPSKKRQIENKTLVIENLVNSHLNGLAQDIGLSEQDVVSIKESWNKDYPLLDISHWLEQPSSKPNRYLWIDNKGNQSVSIIVIEGVKDNTVLSNLASGIEGVTYINKTDEVSNIFQEYRQRITIMVVVGYIVILLLLMQRYGIKKAFMVVLVPAVAAMCSVAVTGWLGLSWNLFGVLAIILVLGIGIDYTLFMVESQQHQASTLLAIWMSALTTILAFGLLSLSNTPAMHTFGITLLAGITVALLLSPFVASMDNESLSKS